MSDNKMQPILIIPPKTMSDADIKRPVLRARNWVKEFDFVRLGCHYRANPVLVQARTEQAAISLSRILLNWQLNTGSVTRNEVAHLYVQALIEGTELSQDARRMEQFFTQEKADEIRRLAREEARAERAALKAAEQKAKA